jgi:hypothetical protein
MQESLHLPPPLQSLDLGFYVEPQCCISCGVPQEVAPSLVGWTDESQSSCIWLKQPENRVERQQAIKVLDMQDIGCHRYAGNDPAILRLLPAQYCDHLHPPSARPTGHFASQGAAPIFPLSVSANENIFVRLWRKLLHK